MSELIYKTAKVEKAFDDRTLAGVITRSSVDEEGEVVIADGLDTSYNDKLDGVSVLWNHDYDKPIGKVRRIEPRDGHVYAAISLSAIDKADEALILARDGILHFSIGFSRIEHGQPTLEEKKAYPGVQYVTRRWKIHELTLTPVPANGDAVLVQKMKKLYDSGHIRHSTWREFEKPELAGFGAASEKRIGFETVPTLIGFGGV